MHRFGMWLWSGMAALIWLGATSSCRKPVDANQSELKEAGYQLKPGDWLRAARLDDVAALKKFVAGGFATDTRDEAGDSALHAAAAAGAQDAADYLLKRGLPLDAPGARNRTPLMAAVEGNQTAMVSWLLRQGADPRTKDAEGFSPLMLAVRDGHPDSVAELAPYHREILDSAILLAALVGQAEVIDTLTNYGASIYARMEDGRNPLMIAAENGHTDCVKLLLDLGSSRFFTDATGRSASQLATDAGHTEIAALITRDPLPGELALESPVEVAQSMDAFMDAALDPPTSDVAGGSPSPSTPPTHHPSRPIDGEILSTSVASNSTPSATPANANKPVAAPPGNPSTGDSEAAASSISNTFPMPPIVMRHYREREVPVQVKSVTANTATLRIEGSTPRNIDLQPGDPVPDSRLVVVRVERRMEDSKLTLSEPTELSVVEVRDTTNGNTREWISGVPSNAHDPVALIEDTATGQRYTAAPGQQFTSRDGSRFTISDVRPNQLIIENTDTGTVQTIPLRGPRG